jgi:hypothetical protein
MPEFLPSDKITEKNGEQFVIRGDKRYQVMWTNKPPGEQVPVLVEVK